MAKKGVDRRPICLTKIRERLLGSLGGLPIGSKLNHAPVRRSKRSPSLLQRAWDRLRGAIMPKVRSVYNAVLARNKNVTLDALPSPFTTGNDKSPVCAEAPLSN